MSKYSLFREHPELIKMKGNETVQKYRINTSVNSDSFLDY